MNTSEIVTMIEKRKSIEMEIKEKCIDALLSDENIKTWLKNSPCCCNEELTRKTIKDNFIVSVKVIELNNQPELMCILNVRTKQFTLSIDKCLYHGQGYIDDTNRYMIKDELYTCNNEYECGVLFMDLKNKGLGY